MTFGNGICSANGGQAASLREQVADKLEELLV